MTKSFYTLQFYLGKSVEKLAFGVIMPRGGKRKGTGRPKSNGESREPTKTVRVPLSFAEKIPELLKQHQEENSVEDLKLPAKAREECLPLEGLAWDAFEAFCLDLIARLKKPKEIYHYGTQGDNQHGIDIVADLNNGEKWAFQCKQWRQFKKGDAIKVIEQAKEFTADRYILLLSRVASVEVRNVITSHPTWEVWDVRNISQKVRRDLADSSLESARRLVRDHFHPEWQNAFLGISKLNPFVSSEDFFHSWLNSNQLFNHTWKLEGRDDALDSLYEFVASSDKQIAILPGRGGIGKTKLLYEFAKTFGQTSFILWFVEEGKLITPENADNLPLHPCIIILDDAHQLEHEQGIKTLLSLMRERSRNQLPEIKLILSTRPHAVKHLELLLRQGGISSTQILLVDELKELKLSDTKALARQALGTDYSHFDKLLATVSRDCPLVTVIGGRLLAIKGVPFSLLDRDEDFQYEVLNHFEKDLTKQVSSHIEPKICEKLLELIAAVSPFQLKNEQFQQVASEFLSIGKPELIKYVGILGQFGVIIQQGTGWKITPDVLSDYILHKACVNHQGYLTGYGQQVFEQFKQICPAQVLANLAELDWRIHYKTGQETDLLSDIWRKIREDFRVSSHYGRWKILGILEEAAYNQPKQTLDLVKFAIHNPATVTESEYISFDTHEAVLNKVPTLLHSISYTMEYLPECCDLLWKLGKDRKDDYKSNPEHPIQVLINLIQYDLYKTFEFHQLILDSVTRWFKKATKLEEINLLLDILDPILQKDFDSNYQEGWTVYFRKIPVSREKTQKLRDQALSLINSCLKSDQVRVIIRALGSLEKALEQRTGALAPLTPKQFVQEWESEQLRIIEILAQFINENATSLLHLEVNRILRRHSYHGLTSAVQQRSRAIINSIPDTYELRLMTVLIHKYRYSWDWDENAESMNAKYKQFMEAMPQRIAKEFLQKYPNAVDGIKVLNEKLEEIRDSSFQVEPSDLLEAIAEADLSYAISMCQLLIQQPDLLLASHLTPLLYKVRLNNPDCAITLIQCALNIENPVLCHGVARIYLGRGWVQGFRSEDHTFIQKLLNQPNLSIRRIAIMSLSRLGGSHPQFALSFALSVNLEDSQELASELYQLFTFDPVINPEILTNKHFEKLLSKLIAVNSIDDPWIEKFLVEASKNVPILVIQLLLTRIAKDIEDFEGEYQPLPYGELKYRYQLNNDEQAKEVLRTIRKTALNKAHTVRFWLPKLFQSILLSNALLSISILDEWIISEEVENIKAVSLLLSAMPQSFAFTYTDCLINLLEQAYELGDECYEATSSNLLDALMIGSRGGMIGQPCQKDVDIRDQSLAIASQLLIGSPAHKFYSSLAKYAEANITRQIALGEAQTE